MLEIAFAADEAEQSVIFWMLARARTLHGGEVSEEEARFWLILLAREPLRVFAGGAERVVGGSQEFAFFLEPLRKYFFKQISQHAEEFLLEEEPALPVNLLRMLLALEPVFDEEVWLAAACYRGFRIIDVDYRNGFKCGSRTAKNFPVSEFAVAQLEGQGREIPSDAPVSVPEPYRYPRDR